MDGRTDPRLGQRFVHLTESKKIIPRFFLFGQRPVEYSIQHRAHRRAKEQGAKHHQRNPTTGSAKALIIRGHLRPVKELIPRPVEFIIDCLREVADIGLAATTKPIALRVQLGGMPINGADRVQHHFLAYFRFGPWVVEDLESTHPRGDPKAHVVEAREPVAWIPHRLKGDGQRPEELLKLVITSAVSVTKFPG